MVYVARMIYKTGLGCLLWSSRSVAVKGLTFEGYPVLTHQ